MSEAIIYALFGAAGGFVVTCGAVAVTVIRELRMQEARDEVRLEQTKAAILKEVKTANSQTMAELIDAVETRRVEEIPAADRTAEEKSHIRAMEQ